MPGLTRHPPVLGSQKSRWTHGPNGTVPQTVPPAAHLGPGEEGGEEGVPCSFVIIERDLEGRLDHAGSRKGGQFVLGQRSGIGAVLVIGGQRFLSVWLVIGVGTIGLGLLLCALIMRTSESRCTRALLSLQLNLAPGA